MSIKALNWAHEVDLPMAQKFVLVTLADHADEDNTCFPSQARIAKRIGSTVRTVGRALSALEAGGFISRQHRTKDGFRTSDRFTLNPADLLQAGNGIELHDNLSRDNNDIKNVVDVRAGTIKNLKKEIEKKKPVPFPKEFLITDAMTDWSEANTPGVHVERETGNFVDYWTIGKGQGIERVSWLETWRKWMRKAQTFAEQNGWKPDPVYDLYDKVMTAAAEDYSAAVDKVIEKRELELPEWADPENDWRSRG